MRANARTDEELLSARDARSFEEFYARHVPSVLRYFARRTQDPELAADLTSETFACALAGRRRYRPEKGAAGAWLFAIASHRLADAQRRGYAERRMCKRLGLERIPLTEDDVTHIEALGAASIDTVLDGLGPDQRAAIQAHVIDERSYDQIAVEMDTSEAVVRKRVSRGLALARRRMKGNA
jgi:RNA polymerase sigma-70 factor, ECF subfamily